MKRIIRLTFALLFCLFSQLIFAQPEKQQSETSEIIIRKDGGKETNITIQIDGEKVLINGKPMTEANEEGVKVLKRKMIISDGSPLLFEGMGEMLDDMEENITIDSSVFLGVSTEKNDKGALINSVSENSPAATSGLEIGDIITFINDKPIADPETLSAEIKSHKSNEEVRVTYLRSGKKKTTKAVLKLKKKVERKVIVMRNGRRPRGMFPDENMRPPLEMRPPMEMNEMPGRLDAPPFRHFPPKQKLGVKIQDTEDGNGVKIIDVAENSVAANAGIQKGDIITEVSGTKINNTDDIRELLGENEDQSVFQVKIKRDGKEMSFEIKPPKKLKTLAL